MGGSPYKGPVTNTGFDVFFCGDKIDWSTNSWYDSDLRRHDAVTSNLWCVDGIKFLRNCRISAGQCGSLLLLVAPEVAVVTAVSDEKIVTEDCNEEYSVSVTFELLGLALLTLSCDKNWDSHSLVNGYPSFYRRIALVAPSPGGGKPVAVTTFAWPWSDYFSNATYQKCSSTETKCHFDEIFITRYIGRFHFWLSPICPVQSAMKSSIWRHFRFSEEMPSHFGKVNDGLDKRGFRLGNIALASHPCACILHGQLS